MAVGSVLVLSSPVATAQQDQGGVGGAIDTLNRALNPEQQRDQRRVRQDERARSGSSARDDRGEPSYRRYSDQDLRDEAYRLEDEARQIDRERRAVEDEMRDRGMRR